MGTMKKPIADRIMTVIWGKYGWDKDSGAHNFWKRKVKKYKKGWDWWRKNAQRIQDREEE